MSIDLRLLRYALALEEHRSFVRAAQEVSISQPVLSRSIQQIEDIVGTRMFERTSTGVFPTDAGKIFLEHAREVVARADDLEREMDLMKGLDKGELHIGSGTYPSAMMVDRAVARIVQMHPAIRLRILTDNWSNLLPRLRKRELDFAIMDVTEVGDDPQLHIRRLNQHQGYLAVRRGHPLLEPKKVLTLRDILQFPLVGSSRFNSPALKQFLAESANGNHGVYGGKSIPSIACESVAMMKTVAASTDAVAVVPLNAVWEEIAAGQLAILPLVSPAVRANFAVVRLSHRSLSPLGESFVQLVFEIDAEILAFEEASAPKLLAAPVPRRSKRRQVAASATAGA